MSTEYDNVPSSFHSEVIEAVSSLWNILKCIKTKLRLNVKSRENDSDWLMVIRRNLDIYCVILFQIMSWRKSYILCGLVLLSKPSLGKDNISVNTNRVETDKESFPSKLRLFVNDWIAQWDPLYKSWFYYNTKTGQLFLHRTTGYPKTFFLILG